MVSLGSVTSVSPRPRKAGAPARDPRQPLTSPSAPVLPAQPPLASAVAWRPGDPAPSGTDANVRITATYHALDQAMAAYLGTPAVPNWMTFGKYASRQAGEQIVRLEELLKIVGRADTDAVVDTLQDLAKNGAALGEQGLALLRLSDGPAGFLRNAQLLRDALVIGNTGVYADIGPAYDRFLRAEAAGRDGVAALKAAGYGQAPRDPQGLVLPAFALYQRARRERATLTAAERRALIHRANMLIVSHEQMVVVQGPRVFGDPRVARLMTALTAEMSVTDARGSQPLLPHGGSWADFATRMGFEEAAPGTPGAFRITDPAGQLHHYVQSEDPQRRDGTIGAYFAGALGEADARTMIGHAPAPLPAAFEDGSDLLRLGRRWLAGFLDRLRQGAVAVLVRGVRARL